MLDIQDYNSHLQINSENSSWFWIKQNILLWEVAKIFLKWLNTLLFLSLLKTLNFLPGTNVDFCITALHFYDCKLWWIIHQFGHMYNVYRHQLSLNQISRSCILHNFLSKSPPTDFPMAIRTQNQSQQLEWPYQKETELIFILMLIFFILHKSVVPSV